MEKVILDFANHYLCFYAVLCHAGNHYEYKGKRQIHQLNKGIERGIERGGIERWGPFCSIGY